MDGLETRFQSRFTAQDEEFERRVRSEARDPPVLEGWRGARHTDTRFQDSVQRGRREWAGPPGWRSGPGGNPHNSANQRHHHHY